MALCSHQDSGILHGARFHLLVEEDKHCARMRVCTVYKRTYVNKLVTCENHLLLVSIDSISNANQLYDNDLSNTVTIAFPEDNLSIIVDSVTSR